MMKLTLAATAATALLATAPTPQERELVEGVIAQVNDDIITNSRFQERYRKTEMLLLQQVSSDQVEQAKAALRKQIFNEMINDLVITQRAGERGIRLTDERFRELVERWKQQIGARSDEEFERALAQQGMNLEEFRSVIEPQYYLDNLFALEVGRDLYQSESRVQNFYEENIERYTLPARLRLSQISIPIDQDNEEEAKTKAEEALARLEAGEDFGIVYRDNTPGADPESNGDIGTLERSALRSELAEAVEGLDVGQHTGIISLPNALIILKLTELTPESVLPLEEIKERVLMDMEAATLRREKRKYLTRIKQQSYIKILDKSYENLYDESYYLGTEEQEG